MKLLSNYNNYINELKITETLRTFPLFLSERLRKMLGEIDHDISTELLSKHSDLDTRVKQTFVDIHPTKAESITFTNPNKAVDTLEIPIGSDEELTDMVSGDNFPIGRLKTINDDDQVYKKHRAETRWGRFINGSFPEKFKLSISGGQNKHDIESFVNSYKSLYNQSDNFELLDIVDGDDIAHWYNHEQYASQQGTLGDSCMKRRGEDTFEIYTSNPDKVRMLIMYENSSKNLIVGRAILWTLSDPDGRIFMDRVYTNSYSDEQTFLDYAKKNGWIRKENQSMGAVISITDTVSDQTNHLTLMCEINNKDYDKYPYCDTMTFYNPHTGCISNKSGAYNAKYELTDTDGGRYTTSSYEETPVYIHSNYHNGDINQNDAKYCKFGDDWVRSSEAIRVWNSGGGENYAVPGNEEIVESKFEKPDGNTYNRWFPKYKCIWSDYLNTWLFNHGNVTTGAKKVWIDLNRNEFILDHLKRVNYNFFEINGEYWHADLVEDGELIGEPGDKITRPVGTSPRGWHSRTEFVDEEGNIFNRGIYQGKQQN